MPAAKQVTAEVCARRRAGGFFRRDGPLYFGRCRGCTSVADTSFVVGLKPIYRVSDLFGHGDRHGLAGAALGDPDKITCGLDPGWCFESFLDHGDACFISSDGK